MNTFKTSDSIWEATRDALSAVGKLSSCESDIEDDELELQVPVKMIKVVVLICVLYCTNRYFYKDEFKG